VKGKEQKDRKNGLLQLVGMYSAKVGKVLAAILGASKKSNG